MPIVTLLENSSPQRNFFNKTYHFPTRKVDIFKPQNDEKSYLLNENNDLSITFFLRNNEAYKEFIDYAFCQYPDYQKFPYEIVVAKKSIKIKGDCSDFISYLALNNCISKKLSDSIKDNFESFENKSLVTQRI